MSERELNGGIVNLSSVGERTQPGCPTGMSSRRLLMVAALCLLSFVVYFSLFMYPLASSFQYWHVTAVEAAIDSGHVRMGDPNAGFYVSTSMVSAATGLECEVIMLLPLQAPAYVMLVVLLLRNASNSTIRQLIVIVVLGLTYATKFGNKASYIWGVHDLGFLILLTAVCCYHVNYRNRRRGDFSSDTALLLVMVVSIVALNYVSYKISLLFIFFLATLYLLEKLGAFEHGQVTVRLEGVRRFAVLAVVYVLSYNTFFYKIALPYVRFAREIFGQTGFEKFIYSLGPLSDYAFRQPIWVRYGDVVWALITAIAISMYGVLFLFGKVRKEEYTFGERLLLSMTFAGIPMLIFYTYLGILEVNYIVFCGFASIVPLSAPRYKISKKIALLLIVGLVAVNIGQNYTCASGSYYQGLSDDEYYTYVKEPCRWYVNHMSYSDSMTVSDIFTIGVIVHCSYEGGRGYFLKKGFSQDDVQFLLGLTSASDVTLNASNAMYVVNNRLDHFQIQGWILLESWIRHRDELASNSHLNLVYSSGAVDMYHMSKTST